MACASPIEWNYSLEIPCDIWYLDSDYSNHMTTIFFPSLDKSLQTDVTLGNNLQVIILGKGTIGILTKQGEQNIMHDVYHV